MSKGRTLNIIGMVFNLMVLASGILIIVSMFMPYLNAQITGNIGGSLGSGWDFMSNKNNTENGERMAYLVLGLIFAIALVLFALMRLIKFPLFNSKLFCGLYVLISIAMMIISILLFSRFMEDGLGIVARGAGLIVHLVFSIIAFIFALGSAVINRMIRR